MFSNDPIWLLLNKSLKLNTRTKSLLFAMGIGGFTFIVIPLFSGYFFPRNDGLSSLDDWPGAIITFFTHPAIYLYYCFEQEHIFANLMKNLFDFHELTERQIFENNLRKALNSKRWTLLATFFTLIGYSLHVQAVLAHPTLSYYYPNKFVLLFINAPLSSLAGYMISLITIRFLIMVLFLFRFYNQYKPKIYPFHPDGCGGLSFIGKFVLRSFILVAIMAIDLSLLIIINLWQTNRDPFTEPSLLSLLSVYLLLFPISIVVPLFSSRAHVQRIKQNLLFLIGTELDKQSKALANIDMVSVYSQADELFIIRNLYKLLADLSVIPIDKTTKFQVGLLVLVSLMPILFLFMSIALRGV
jgi:hypothetical protein